MTWKRFITSGYPTPSDPQHTHDRKLLLLMIWYAYLSFDVTAKSQRWGVKLLWYSPWHLNSFVFCFDVYMVSIFAQQCRLHTLIRWVYTNGTKWHFLEIYRKESSLPCIFKRAALNLVPCNLLMGPIIDRSWQLVEIYVYLSIASENHIPIVTVLKPPVWQTPSWMRASGIFIVFLTQFA